MTYSHIIQSQSFTLYTKNDNFLQKKLYVRLETSQTLETQVQRLLKRT